jgi:hypothetical protein
MRIRMGDVFFEGKNPPLEHNNSHVLKYFIIGTGWQFFSFEKHPASGSACICTDASL